MDMPSALNAEDVEFLPLSPREWRVSDRRYSRHEIGALLGFVARQGDDFYVTRMNHPLEAERVGSLDEVAAFFAAAAGAVDSAAGSHPQFAGS